MSSCDSAITRALPSATINLRALHCPPRKIRLPRVSRVSAKGRDAVCMSPIGKVVPYDRRARQLPEVSRRRRRLRNFRSVAYFSVYGHVSVQTTSSDGACTSRRDRRGISTVHCAVPAGRPSATRMENLRNRSPRGGGWASHTARWRNNSRRIFNGGWLRFMRFDALLIN